MFVLSVVALSLGGCVKVNSPDVGATDFRASVRFANFVNLAGAGTMTVNVDKSSSTTATVTLDQVSSPYSDLPAGARFFQFNYGGTSDTLHLALTAYTQYTMYSEFEPQNGDAARSYMLVPERRTFTGAVPFPADTQVVRLVNMSTDTAADVSGGLTFTFKGGSTDTMSDPVAFGSASPYYQAAASSNPQYTIVGATGTVIQAATTVGAAAGRYSVVFVGSQAAGTWQAIVFKEN